MAKKDFTKSIGSKNLSSLIPTNDTEQENQQNRGVGEKKTEKVEKKSASAKKKQKTDSTTVTTFRINDDNLFAIKAIAFWERKKIQDVLNEALTSYLGAIPANTLKKAKDEFKKRNQE